MRRAVGVWIFIVVMAIVMWGYVSGVANEPSPRYIPVTPVVRAPSPTPARPWASPSAAIKLKTTPANASPSAAVTAQ